MNNIDDYLDIINLPHHNSSNHKRMSMEKRASQFSPFAALTGYEELVKETARLTDKRIEIDEEVKQIINDKLQIINKNIKNKPKATFTYFIPDLKKNGGKYVNLTRIVKKIDEFNGIIILEDNCKIPITEIIDINF